MIEGFDRGTDNLGWTFFTLVPQQDVSEARDLAQSCSDLLLVFQCVEVVVQSVDDDIAKCRDLVWGGVEDDHDDYRKDFVVPEEGYGFSEILFCEIAEPIGLVLDRRSEHFRMRQKALGGPGDRGVVGSCGFRSADGFVAGVFEMIEARDHQLDDLRVIACLVRIALVGTQSFELDDSGLPFLLL